MYNANDEVKRESLAVWAVDENEAEQATKYIFNGVHKSSNYDLEFKETREIPKHDDREGIPKEVWKKLVDK